MAEFQGFLAIFFRCALILGQRSMGWVGWDGRWGGVEGLGGACSEPNDTVEVVMT